MKPNTSKILKELRVSKKKTQQDIADILEISRQAYSRYESNSREPGIETLAKLAEYYNVSPQIFFMSKIDSPIDEEMDIVELSAIYQAKKAVYSNDNSEKEYEEESNFSHESEIDVMKKMLFSKLDYKIKSEDLEKREDISEDDKKRFTKMKKKHKIKLYIMYTLIILFTINIGIMFIHRLDTTYDYPIFKHSYINAISPGQNVNQTMYTDIVKITKFDVYDVRIGDSVVIYSDFDVDEYWVEEITAISLADEEITTTYDGISAIRIPFEDVVGIYSNNSNLLGTIYYTAKFNTGFLFLTTGHLLFLSFYYYSFLNEKGKYY